MNKFTLSIMLSSFFITSDFVDVAHAASDEEMAIWRQNWPKLAAQIDEERRLKEQQWNELMKPENLEKSHDEEIRVGVVMQFDTTVTIENYPWLNEALLAEYNEYRFQLLKELRLESEQGPTYYRDFAPEEIIKKKRNWLASTERQHIASLDYVSHIY